LIQKLKIPGFLLLIFLLCVSYGHVFAQGKSDTLRNTNDSLRYPLKDRRGDRFSWRNRNPFYLNDTSFLKENILYDPVTNEYYIVEKIGNTYYRKPTYLTMDEMLRIQGRNDEIDYFNKRAQTLSLLNQKVKRPKMRLYDRLFDRILVLVQMV